jgi:hypothetical protein
MALIGGNGSVKGISVVMLSQHAALVDTVETDIVMDLVGRGPQANDESRIQL